jgi:hypothetical protein
MNVIVSWRIAHLLAVKYPTATSTHSESRTLIPRFIFILDAPALEGHSHASGLCDPVRMIYVTTT